jgi:hypothetical protein
MRIKRQTLQRRQAYSLLEMVVVLLLTSIIMMALITLVATILRVSATTHARSLAREELINFVQEFEKDLRNSAKVGECGGNEAGFKCDVFTNAPYRWQSCEREVPQLCSELGATCDLKGVEISMCKYLLDSSGNPTGDPVLKFNDLYNLEKFGITSVGETVVEGEGTEEGPIESTRKVISFTAVASHPNKRLGINNLIRQSIVSTKNFELVVRTNASEP